MRLNLGCSIERIEGYINIDDNVDADMKHNLLKALPFPDNSIDEVLASHLLEHFDYVETDQVLKDWYRVLKPGGILHIRVPDMAKVCEDYINSDVKRRENWAIKEIYGGQWNSGEYHKNGFDEYSLIRVVENIGFKVDKILPPRSKDKAYPRFEGDREIRELNIIFKK